MHIEWVWVARSVMITNLECSQNRNAVIKKWASLSHDDVLGVEGTWCRYMYIILLCIFHWLIDMRNVCVGIEISIQNTSAYLCFSWSIGTGERELIEHLWGFDSTVIIEIFIYSIQIGFWIFRLYIPIRLFFFLCTVLIWFYWNTSLSLSGASHLCF